MPSASVRYTRRKRTAGQTKYPTSKMLLLAFNGITSFSVVPLRFITVLGVLMSCASLILALYFLTGYFSVTMSLPVGLPLLYRFIFRRHDTVGLGIVGEYIGKVFVESKKRPVIHGGKDRYRRLSRQR